MEKKLLSKNHLTPDPPFHLDQTFMVDSHGSKVNSGQRNFCVSWTYGRQRAPKFYNFLMKNAWKPVQIDET